MDDKKEKSTSRFLHSIDKYARKQRLKIAEEIKQIEEERLKREESKIVENARTLMMSELANVRTEIFIKVSNAKTVSVQKICRKKSDIEKEIFDDCEMKIKAFTESDEYKVRLRKSVDYAIKVFGESFDIYVREKDFEFLSSMCQDDRSCKLFVSKKIKRGGLVFSKNGVVLDDTFDTSIMEQRKIFSRCYFSKLV